MFLSCRKSLPKHLYIFSGLGADKRVFQNLDLSPYSVSFVNWLSPFKGESMEDYARRLSASIQTPKPILIGVSFGGMMAIEIAKHVDVEKIILISSAKTRQEIPLYYRIFGLLGLQRLVPPGILTQSNHFTNWFFGAEQTKDKLLLKQILIDTDSAFLKWAITGILQWKNSTPNNKTFHIHGTQDKILPLRFIQADAIIKGGGHLMILNKAEEISEILRIQL